MLATPSTAFADPYILSQMASYDEVKIGRFRYITSHAER